MPGDDGQTNLIQFDGDEAPIEDDGRTDSESDDRPPEEPFVLELKPSTRERNPAVDAIAADGGRLLEFDSRVEAEAFAARMTGEGGVRVRLQAVAPQDETTADAYLVPQPIRHRDAPIDPDATTWAFQPGANQYGAIGQALMTTPRTNPPALTYYVRQDLGIDDEGGLRVRLREPSVVTARTADGARARWLPDAVAEATRESTGALLRTYCCEIKTGNASFERQQATVMERKAAEPGTTVLQIRVEIDALPDEYGVRIHEVEP
ncbi:hypothetical protein [Halosolutus halophilus]|uniref:hypothetical protein n=1 Tax=Halosolutus halophilus TaxID=1552990 RepID=UPI002235265D|nr:hypothetical protein [Halosolutus halophilus]